jgi:4-hydroxybenzoate polyprenyltransferase
MIGNKIVNMLESTPLDIPKWFVSFGAIIFIRLLLENLLLGYEGKTISSMIGSFLHTLTFFAFSFLVITVVFCQYLKISFQTVARVFLWGQWIILLPPVVDAAIFRGKTFYSFYIFDSYQGILQRFFLLFGNEPDFGITYGTRLEVVLVSLLVAFYVFVKTKKITKALGGLFIAYLVLFLLGCFPAIISPFLSGNFYFDAVSLAKLYFSPYRVFGVGNVDMFSALHFRMSLLYILGIFLLLNGVLWMKDKLLWKALFRNIRFPQMSFNGGLLVIGMLLGAYYYPQNVNLSTFSFLSAVVLLLAVFSAWFFSVFINDIVDQKIDLVTNSSRPLVKNIFTLKQYWDYSLIFFILSLTAALIVSVPHFLIVVCYHFLTTVYSYPPFRLKRFLGVASIISSFSSLLILLMGFILMSDQQGLADFPWRIYWALFVCYIFIIPLKDLKDIEGDRGDGVFTLAVMLGETKTRLVIAIFVLCAYFVSVFVLYERALFLPAFVFGSLNYWIITNKKINNKNILGYTLLTVSVYGFLMAGILFG